MNRKSAFEMRRRRFLYLLGFSTGIVSRSARAQWITKPGGSVLWQRRGGAAGASPAWYDSVSVASTDTDNYSSAGTELATIVTPTQSGTCSNLRVYVAAVLNTGLHIKMALYQGNKSTYLGGAVCTLTADTSHQNQYYECPITGVAVTSGNNYYVAFECEYGDGSSSNGAYVVWRYKNATASGSAIYMNCTYTAFPANPFVSLGDLTRTYAVSMYVAP